MLRIDNLVKTFDGERRRRRGLRATAADDRVFAVNGISFDVEEGEICMRGPLVQPKYWAEDETPYAEDGWAHFGDLGRLDEDGYLHVTGRVKDTIIRGGSNINPFEVEDVLRGSAVVQDVCVVGRPDDDLGERAVAFVVPAHGSDPTLDDLTAHLDEAGLTRYKWPEALRLLDAIPHGATGKVDRKGLRERAKEDG